jgi:glycosyltransferase involved in cell wall biosynthesis
MAAALRREAPRADLLHAHAVFLWPTRAAVAAARAAGRPCVISPRGMLVRELIAARSRIAKRLWIALVERANLRAAAAIHATSAHERDALLELGLGPLPRIEVIPNGVDLPPSPPPPPAARRVLFLGRLSPEKQVDRLLAAMAAVPAATLDVLGPDPAGLAPGLARQADALGIAGRVRFAGATDAAGVQAALAACDVLVLPSRSENFGNVVAEAMAMARPVVATERVGAAALVRRAAAGRVVDDTPAALARAISGLLDAPAEAAAAGAAGRAFVARELSWDAVARSMRALYAELAGARR